MTTFASGQSVASNPAQFQIGVPTQKLLDGYTFGAQASIDLIVGKPCFYLDQNGQSKTVKNVNSGNNFFAGFVLRSNANSMDPAGSFLGYSNLIPRGQTCSVMTRGSLPILLDLAQEVGGLPKVGSEIFVLFDGTIWSQEVGGSIPSGFYFNTNFRILRVYDNWGPGGAVEISNTQNVGL